jgi:outer membrane protein assembly factor BamB
MTPMNFLAGRPAAAWAAGLYLLVVAVTAHAENWPGWRGPRGDGTSLDPQAPIRWDGTTGDSQRWKTAVPGVGYSSPIVWQDRIFLASCLLESNERVLLCLDRTTGSLVWQQTVIKSPLETKHALNSYASSTPATDGESVYVAFLEVDGSTIPAPNVSQPRPVTPGKIVVAAYDFLGERKWLVRPGDFISAHGFCTNPVLYGDLLVINGDHDGESYLCALDKRTGATVWKTPRRHKTRSYATPQIGRFGDRDQLVLGGSFAVTSFDPHTGSPLWWVEGVAEQWVASTVSDGERVYAAGGFPTYHVLGIRPDGRGDVTTSHVDWHVTKIACYCPSPVLSGDYLLVADDRGTANCFQRKTGERLWQARLGDGFHASLVAAGGLVYFLADNGVTKVVRPGPQLDIAAENPLGQDCSASPAIAAGQFFIRGKQHLFCFGP